MNNKTMLMVALIISVAIAGCAESATNGQDKNTSLAVEKVSNSNGCIGCGSIEKVNIKQDGVVCYTYGSGAGAGISCIPENEVRDQ